MALIEQVAEGLRLHWLLPIEADDVIYSNCLLYCGYQATIMIQLGKSHKSLLACDPVYGQLLQHCYLQFTERKSCLDFGGVEFWSTTKVEGRWKKEKDSKQNNSLVHDFPLLPISIPSTSIWLFKDNYLTHPSAFPFRHILFSFCIRRNNEKTDDWKNEWHFAPIFICLLCFVYSKSLIVHLRCIASCI